MTPTPAPEGSAHLRRRPTQRRSRERVDRILDSAAALVVERGVDHLRVGDIAQRAGVPLGTVYQFFARKDDIVHALAERFADRFGDVLQDALGGLPEDAGWREVLDALLDAYADHYRTEPALRELWIGTRLDPEFLKADHERNNTRFAVVVAGLMAARAVVPRDELALMVFVTWEACQALLETAFRADPQGDPAVIAQTRLLAARYLAPAFEPAP